MVYPWGMIQKDYILRLIEQCVELLLVAAGRKKLEAAEAELAQAVLTWTGLDLELAAKLSTESLVQLLGAGSLGAGERMLLVGQAIGVRCMNARARGEAQEALALRDKAVGLIEAGLELRPDMDNQKLQDVLAAIRG